jgi:hypothetical protein
MANKLTRVHIEGVPIPRYLDDILQAGAWYQQRTKQRKAWFSGRFVVPDKALKSYRFSGFGFEINFKQSPCAASGDHPTPPVCGGLPPEARNGRRVAEGVKLQIKFL